MQAGKWRHSAQANDWVGKVIAQTLSLELEDKGDEEKPVTGRVKQMIKTWIASKALKVKPGAP